MCSNSPCDKLSVGKMSLLGKYSEKFVMWKNMKTNLSCEEISPNDKCGDKSVFFTIYAVLSRNMFCCHLRCCFVAKKISSFLQYLHAFVWRKIEQEIVPVEKKGQNQGGALH